jgi:hypothetical protein
MAETPHWVVDTFVIVCSSKKLGQSAAGDKKFSETGIARKIFSAGAIVKQKGFYHPGLRSGRYYFMK